MIPVKTILRNTKHIIDTAPSITYSRRKLKTLTCQKNIQLFMNKSKPTLNLEPCPSSSFSNSYSQHRHKHYKSCDSLTPARYRQGMNDGLFNAGHVNGLLRGVGGIEKCRLYSSKSDFFTNPIDRLQKFVDVPIVPQENLLFNPSEKEIRNGAEFWSQNVKEMNFLKSAKFKEQLPEDNLPEVTFIGRSNVGKSSLIQALFIKSDVVVRISKTPGHTRLLNFFEVKEHFRVVDVPGYGFRMPEDYPEMVEDFLKTRPRLARTFLLIDVATGLNETDMIGINMVEEFKIPYVFVITKIDKVKQSILLRNLLEIQRLMKDTKYCFSQPFLVSAVTGEGIPLLQTFIAYVTGNIPIQGL